MYSIIIIFNVNGLYIRIARTWTAGKNRDTKIIHRLTCSRVGIPIGIITHIYIGKYYKYS